MNHGSQRSLPCCYCPAGEARSKETPPGPVPAPPPSAEAQGGLAGVRTAGEPISHAVDGSTPAHGPPAALSAVPALASGGAGGGPRVVDHVADFGTMGEAAEAAEEAGTTAAVSTHAGPEADPYHLGG